MSDIQFTIGDKEIADTENNKLSIFEDDLKNSNLPEEELHLLTQAIFDGANDALIEKSGGDEQDI